MDRNTQFRRARVRLKADPNDRNASRELAQSIGAQGEWKTAAEWMKQHVEQHPDDAAGWNLLCAYLLELNELLKAEVAARKALDLAPDDHVYHYNLACTLAQIGDLDSALDSLKLACACDDELVDMAASDPHLRPLYPLDGFQTLVG